MGLQVAGAHQFLEHVVVQPDVVELHDQPVTGGLRTPDVSYWGVALMQGGILGQ